MKKRKLNTDGSVQITDKELRKAIKLLEKNSLWNELKENEDLFFDKANLKWGGITKEGKYRYF